MENKIIKIAGKPLEKLVGVIKEGLGLDMSKSEFKKEKELEIGSLEESTPLFHPNGRIQERLVYKETKRQQNLNYINFIAAEQLSQEETVSQEPLEDDWIHRFFNIAEDISNEEMQTLWGRILAGEVKQPKTYSLRTLEFLKNLSKAEAEVFTKFAEIKVTSGDKNFVYNQDKGKFLEDEFGITFSDILLLTELGLIASEKNLEFSFNPTGNSKTTNIMTLGSKAIVLFRNENTPKQPLEILLFTKKGLELSKLITQNVSIKYIEKICSCFKHDNVKIEYGNYIITPDRNFALFNKVEFNK